VTIRHAVDGGRLLAVDGLHRTLVENAPDAIIYADAKGRIFFWNTGAERVFGFSSSEAIRQSLDIIIPANLRKRHWDGYHATVLSGTTRYGAGDILAVPALRKNATPVSIEFSILPFLDDAGRIVGIAILRDVTRRFNELKALRKELATHRQTEQTRPTTQVGRASCH
jgi:PAS domain S-box-containing protein